MRVQRKGKERKKEEIKEPHPLEGEFQSPTKSKILFERT
jgi:hypothetical protein